MTGQKYFRKLPLIGGLITLYISFAAVIPISILSSLFGFSFGDISLEFFTINGIETLYLWGILESGPPITIETNFSQFPIPPDSLIPFIFWIITLISGICGVIGSSYNAKPENMKKLIKISAFFLIFELVYYLSGYFNFYTAGDTVLFGTGFYCIIILIVIFVVSSLRISDYHEIE
ncbi:MAG: hypothetical protein ACTSWY_07990 [Promethearchaeota archaeon]